MSKTKGKPDSNGRAMGFHKDYEVIFFRLPKQLKEVIVAAAAYESLVRGHDVTQNEFVARACIDRIGEIYGHGIAKRFYQQYFNGLAPFTGTDIRLPECREK